MNALMAGSSWNSVVAPGLSKKLSPPCLSLPSAGGQLEQS
jgi:hypothetical protein